MAGSIQRLLGPFREFGFGVGLLYMADRALRALSPKCGLYVYELLAQPIVGKPLLPSGLARNLRSAEICSGHPDLALMPAREDIKSARFEQGARCLGVYKSDELIGYVWFCRDRYEEDEVRCTYLLADPASGVFDFDLVVVPKHRMGIGFVALWDAANRFLAAQGVSHTFSRMTRFNLSSRRAHARMGARCVGRATFLQVGRLELMLASVQPYVACTFTGRVPLRLKAGPSDAIPRRDLMHGDAR